jgi:hypothetical protein
MRYLYATLAAGALLAAWGHFGSQFGNAAALAVIVAVPAWIVTRPPKKA